MNTLTHQWANTQPYVNFQQIKHKLRHIINKTVSQCTICHMPSTIHRQICQHCLNALPFFHIKEVDGDLLNWPAVNQLFKQRHFDRLICVTPYDWPLSQWIQSLKFKHQFNYAHLLAFTMQKQWQNVEKFKSNASNIDIVLSIPTYINKWQQRGFNQSHLIAKAFSQANKLKYMPNVLVRTSQSQSQVEQTGNQRRKNLVGNFKVISSDAIQEKHVLLIDDVLTTGSTINEVSKVLKAAGVSKVTVFTLCLSLEKC